MVCFHCREGAWKLVHDEEAKEAAAAGDDDAFVAPKGSAVGPGRLQLKVLRWRHRLDLLQAFADQRRDHVRAVGVEACSEPWRRVIDPSSLLLIGVEQS